MPQFQFWFYRLDCWFACHKTNSFNRLRMIDGMMIFFCAISVWSVHRSGAGHDHYVRIFCGVAEHFFSNAVKARQVRRLFFFVGREMTERGNLIELSLSLFELQCALRPDSGFSTASGAGLAAVLLHSCTAGSTSDRRITKTWTSRRETCHRQNGICS